MTRRRCLIRFAAGGVVFLAAAAPLYGVTQLRRGAAPPPIDLQSVDGQSFSLAAQKDAVVIVVFGELYHPRTLEACRIIREILANPRVEPARARCVVVVAQQADAGTLKESAQKKGLTWPVLHDRQRTVFAAYQVSVLPSVVVLDRQGRVVHAVAGMSAAFRDVVTDAVLLGAGLLDVAQFEKTVHPSTAPSGAEPAQRAARLTELAWQLSRSGQPDLAVAKFQEALTVDPRHVAALEGLGRVALQRKRLAEAETHFRAASAIDASSLGATTGLIYVQVLRGGAELPKAEQRLHTLLEQRPYDAELHYLLGLANEQAGRNKESAASYRRAAEILLARGGG